MVLDRPQLEEVNVLASAADWAWPLALRDIFAPRGVSLLVADSANDFLSILRHRRIHTTIVDMDSKSLDGLATIRIIRIDYPLLPCILLTNNVDQDVLGRALELDVFGVVDKPVDLDVLRELLNRLFLKKYDSNIFA